MPEFEIRNIMCPFDCRFGLQNKSGLICRHLKTIHVEELAAELLEFELCWSEPSELFKTVQLYVDDPKFWSNCLRFSEKLHRHAPSWIQDAFIESTRHQLLRLSGTEMTKINEALFLKRVKQLMLLTSTCDMHLLHDEINYWISNITRANPTV